MLPRIDPAPVTDTAPADWLEGQLVFGGQVRQWLPDSFEAYVRVLHPATIDRKVGDAWTQRLVPWAEIGAWSGKVVQTTSNLISLQVRADNLSWRDQKAEDEHWNDPREGHLVGPQLDSLGDLLSEATATPDLLWMLVWNGWGVDALASLGHQELDISASLTASGRKYFLCRGALEDVDPSHEALVLREPPSFWWPADRAWFVSTDIDLPSTYVGGSASLAERILADERLEALPASLEDPYGGEAVPPP